MNYELDDVDKQLLSKLVTANRRVQNGDPLKDFIDEDDCAEAIQLCLNLARNAGFKPPPRTAEYFGKTYVLAEEFPPKVGDMYYFPDVFGVIESLVWTDSEEDAERLDFSLVFLTFDSAESLTQLNADIRKGTV